jgi:hypothetical protein
VGADRVPGVVERLLGVGGGRAVDQRAVASGGAEGLEAVGDGAVVGFELDAFEGSGAENGGWVGGRVHRGRTVLRLWVHDAIATLG